MADAELNKLLAAQRREMDPKRRREIVLEIQRYVADKGVLTSTCPTRPSTWPTAPYVKGFVHHDGSGLGLKLMFTWLDK